MSADGLSPQTTVFPQLHEIVENNAAWYGERPALLHDSTTLSWTAFCERMHRLAVGLSRAGVEPGARVAVLAGNSLDYVVLQYALSVIGGVLVPVNIRLTSSEVAYMLGDCRPTMVLHDLQHQDLAVDALSTANLDVRPVAVDSAPAAAGLWSWTEDTWCGPDEPGAAGAADDPRGWARPYAILYTGGTTGYPKGAMIGHGRGLVDGISVAGALGLRDGERFLCVSPLSHTAAWDYIKAYFLVGGSAVIQPRFVGAATVDALERHRCNGIWAVPLMLREMISCERFGQADLSSVSLIAYSAYDPSDLMLAVVEAFRSRGAASVRIAHGYGLTEAGPFVTILRPEEATEDPSSVGTPVAGAHVALLRVEDGKPALPGEIGEVCVRSAAVMSGYWERPDEDAAVFKGGWLHSGDLGRINKFGHLEIVDRQKDMVRTAGENVYAKEVEIAAQAFLGVMDCAVIGRHDDRYDERVVAFVVGDVDLDELRAYMRSRLAGFKVPKEFILLGQLPKTAAGKTAKSALRREYP